MMKKPQDNIANKNKKTALAVLAIVVGMIGLAYASVPLYDLFCRVTGFGGTTQVAETLPDEVLERKITVRFDGSLSKNMPWDFKPIEREISVKIGEKGITAYTAENKSDKPVSGAAIYNVAPLKAGKYFHKVACFCFQEQTLRPKENVRMPVVFYVDPSMDDDPNMKDVQSITLSYTFFPIESPEYEAALEEFYDQ